MNFRVLKAFLVVSRFGNITRTSEFLHISQPALSRQIAELEAELDTRLFERTSRRLTLTANGLLFESRARKLVKIYEEIRDELRQAENEYTGLIRFGCVESSVVEFVIDVFTELMQHYPHLTFELYAADGDDIREALDHGNLDMGILLEPVEAAKYESIPLPWSDRWGIVVSENSPEAKLENISIQQLSDMRLILPRRWIVQDEIASWMGIAREHLNVLMYHNLPTLPIRFVQKGIGAVLCVEGSYGVRPAAGTRFLPLSPEQRAGHRLVRRRNIKPSKVCRLVWDTAQKYVSAFAQVDE